MKTLETEKRTPGAVDWVARFERLSSARESRLAMLQQLYAEHGPGLELTNSSRTSWTVILPDASAPGRWRHQQFDERGFVGHCTRDTVDAVLADAMDCGYRRADPGALDRLSTTPQWAHGIRMTAIIAESNAGLISWAETTARIKASQVMMTQDLARRSLLAA